LLGAGAVAALIGLATLLPGGAASTPPATTESAAPTAAPSAEVTATAPPVATATVAAPPVGPTATNSIALPTVAPVAPANPAPVNPAPRAGSPAVAHAPVRVYNNSTITGLAARAAQDFRADGWQVAQVANYPTGVIATSTVYYRPGTTEQSAASSLASAFGLRMEPRFTGIDDATPGLIVIVTNDYQKRAK
jgi:hypothetical protein